MPSLVRVAAAADQSALDDDTTMDVNESILDPDESLLDKSVNMLLDDTIHSESESDSDSTVSAEVETDRKPSERSDPTGARKETDIGNGEKRSKSILGTQIGAGPETSRMDGDNNETKLSNSDSSLDPTERKPNRMDEDNDLSDSNSSIYSPERKRTFDKQSSLDRQANSTIDNLRERQGDDRHEYHGQQQSHGEKGANDELRMSDSDSFLDTPPRRSTKLHRVKSIQSKRSRNETSNIDETRTSDDNDETRVSDDNDETRLESSFQDTQCSPSNQVENTGRGHESEQVTKQEDSKGLFQSRRPSPEELEWWQQKNCYEFQSKFKKTVCDFERRYPRVKLRDYQTLSSEEQSKEQQNVVNILDRLGIRRKSPEEGGPVSSTLDDRALDKTCVYEQYMSTARREESPVNTQPRADETESQRGPSLPRRKESDEKNASRSQQKRATLEAVQLPTIAGASPNIQSSFGHNSGDGFSKGGSPNFRADSPIFTGGDSISELSVEITRGANYDGSMSPYKSPQLHISDRSSSKRLASTSGKRGKDSFRVKLNEASRAYSSDSDDQGLPLAAPSFHSSDDFLSMVSAHGYEDNGGQPFSASQSPIAGADRRSDYRSQHHPTQRQRQSYRDDSREGRRARRSPSEERYSIRRGTESPSQESCSARHRRNDRSSRRQNGSSSRRQDYMRNDSRHRREKRFSHRREKHSDEYAYDNTIDTVNATVFRDHERRPRMRDKTNVQLKEGMPFHYNPLQIKRTKRTSRNERTTKDCPRHRAVDFRDPLSEYVGEEGEELLHVFEWMRDRDNVRKSGKWRSESKGIIFSLEAPQIVNVTLKLLLENMDSEREDKFEDISSLSGQTLIVVRTKEEIATWEHALREHTPLTVQNHAELPSSKRKRSATASECATFDIVITTFDALKGQDSTVQIDDDGHVILGQEAESQGGWMTKRLLASSGACQRMGGFSQRIGVGACGNSQRVDCAIQCRQLSVLHRLQWRRVIFTDDLGRKCFLAKHGTAKAQAASAVNGHSRFVFFSKEKEDKSSERSAFESFMRSDKRAIQSVASILHLRFDDEDEELFDVMLDPAQGI